MSLLGFLGCVLGQHVGPPEDKGAPWVAHLTSALYVPLLQRASRWLCKVFQVWSSLRCCERAGDVRVSVVAVLAQDASGVELVV